MAKSNSKEIDSCEHPLQAKSASKDATELVKVELPPYFPFNGLVCIQDHKEIFKSLFNEQ